MRKGQKDITQPKKLCECCKKANAIHEVTEESPDGHDWSAVVCGYCLKNCTTEDCELVHVPREYKTDF